MKVRAEYSLLGQEIRPPKDKADYEPKKLVFSLPLEALPEGWQSAIADFEAGIDGIGLNAPAPSIAKTQVRKICEFAKASLDSGHDIEMTVQTATAYEKSLLDRKRPLSPTTIMSAMRHIRDFALYRRIISGWYRRRRSDS